MPAPARQRILDAALSLIQRRESGGSPPGRSPWRPAHPSTCCSDRDKPNERPSPGEPALLPRLARLAASLVAYCARRGRTGR